MFPGDWVEPLWSFSSFFFIPTPTADYDRDFLSGVKRGFSGDGVGIPWEMVFVFIWLLAFLIVILLLVRRWLKPAPTSFGPKKLDQITDPDEIRSILDKSIGLRTIFDMEIFDPAYTEIYKGPILGINEDDEIEVELSSFKDLTLDFKEKDVRAVFRLNHKGRNEFFEFDSISRYIGLTDISGQKEKAVRLTIPRRMSVGQKRRYMRVEPSGRFAFKVRINTTGALEKFLPLHSFRTLHEAEVVDLSLGGLQAMFLARSDEVKVRTNDEVYVHFRLPTAELGLKDIPRTFFVQARVLSVQRVPTGRRVMSRLADEQSVGPHIVRLIFTGRGGINREAMTISFRPHTPLVFDDLARWIQAYERQRIQEERGTKPRPSRVRNRYERKPPEVEPKYPPQPPDLKK